MRWFVLTGTAVIPRAQAQGEDEPCVRASFVGEVVALQRTRQQETPAGEFPQVFG